MRGFLKEGGMAWKQRHKLSFPTFCGGVRSKWPLVERPVEEMRESKSSASAGTWRSHSKKKLKASEGFAGHRLGGFKECRERGWRLVRNGSWCRLGEFTSNHGYKNQDDNG